MTDHAEIHCSKSTQAPSSIPTVIYQIPNTDIFYNEVTLQQSPKSGSPESVSELRLQQRTEMKPQRLETLDNSVEYTMVEDGTDDSDSEEEEEDSSSSDDSSSPDCSSDSSDSLHSKETVAPPTCVSGSICAACGRGPFRSMKLHLLHCSGIQVKYECSLCKELFLTEDARKKHYMPLHLCSICDQVFSHESLYHNHQCPKKSKARPLLVLFCSEMMPKACNICKSFFTSEKTLLNHINRVHTSVVSTKICIITDSSAVTKKKASQSLHGTAAKSATTTNEINQDSNGKLPISLPSATSHPTFGRTSHSPLSMSHRHSSQLFMASAASPARREKDDALGEPTNRSPTRLSAQADTTPATPASGPDSPPAPNVLALFENGSKKVALMKRMNTSWRSKVSYSCKQCGAILRQPASIISHRYLHRGHRSHRCQCGRAFKHRLHLLRHCVEHAEAMSYICVSCGETFFGARLLAEHMKGKSQRKSAQVKRKCRMAFTCECGQLFLRPSAYIWHQLQNWTKTRQAH